MKKLLHALGSGNRASETPRGAVGKKLLFPITWGMAVLFFVLAGALYWQYETSYDRQTRSEITSAAKLYHYTVTDYRATMSGIVDLLASDERIPDMLRNKDADGLLALYTSAFAKMQQSCGLTYLLFADHTNRVIVRVHDPDDREDMVRRVSFSEAEQDNNLVTTLDAGSDGRLSLRVVASIMSKGKQVGFVEAGMEMERVLAAAAQSGKVDLALALDKSHISAERIHPGQPAADGAAFWFDPGGAYYLYTTLDNPDAELAGALLRGLPSTGAYDKITLRKEHYAVSAAPLADSAGDALGELFILQNTTSLRNEYIVTALILLGTVLAIAAASRMIVARRLHATDADFAQMENTIDDGKRVFETVFAESGTGFVLRLTQGGGVLKANRAALTAFSATREEELDLSRLTPVPAGHVAQEAWQSPLLTIEPSAAGRFFEQSFFSLGSNKTLEGIALRDVTDGVLLQSENKAHITFLQSVINQLPGWVCIKDSSLRLTQTNDAFSALFGPKSELDGDVRHSEWLGEDMDRLLEADREALRSGKAVTFEMKISAKEKEFVYQVTKQRFTGRDGQIFILSSGSDISERVRMMEQLVVLHKKSEEAALAKTHFLARMTHELRTPMNIVLGMSYLALKLAPGGRLREYVTKIQESADKLLKIITDIIEYSAMETGEISLEYSEFDLAEELETVAKQVRSLLGNKAVAFTFETRGTDGQFMGDALRIRQVLLALCDNAVKFTEEGSIRLTCVVSQKTGSTREIRFSVEDTGIGIAGEDISRLFDSFDQLDGSMTRKYGGTGVGLPLARQALTLMGSSLEVESAPGTGSRFSFTISLERSTRDEKNKSSIAKAAPLQDSAEPETRPAGKPDTEPAGQQETKPTGEQPFPPARILVVEDNDLNQEIILELLTHAGLQAQAVCNGVEAVEIVKTQSFDLILMDLQMPVMGGIEATRRIREFESGSDVLLPIIALTANTLESDRSDCARAGMNGFLSKPIDVDQLYALLRQWLIKTAHGPYIPGSASDSIASDPEAV